MLKQRNPKLKSNAGMAVIEMIPILIIVALLINFSIGFFGIVHTGILTSIAARNYAFETFRHRANLTYFSREEDKSNVNLVNYMKGSTNYGFRLHGIASENRPSGNENWVATARNIAFVEPFGGVDKDGNVLAHENNKQNTESDLHNNRIFTIRDDGNRNALSAAPVWIRPTYGICIKATCQPQQ